MPAPVLRPDPVLLSLRASGLGKDMNRTLPPSGTPRTRADTPDPSSLPALGTGGIGPGSGKGRAAGITLGRDRAAWSSFRRCWGSLMPISRRSCSSITLGPWEQRGKSEGLRHEGLGHLGRQVGLSRLLTTFTRSETQGAGEASWAASACAPRGLGKQQPGPPGPHAPA